MRRSSKSRADDRSQQVVEVVRQTTGKLSDCFHLLGLDEPFFGALAFRDLCGETIVRAREIAVRSCTL